MWIGSSATGPVHRALAPAQRWSVRLAAAKGRAQLKLTPVEFAAEGLQPHDLSQLLAGLEATRGRFDAEWLLSWGDAPSRSDLSVGLRDLTGRWSGGLMACTPKVQLEAPDEPITINLNGGWHQRGP